MNYFGAIHNEDFKNWPIDLQDEYLVQKEVFARFQKLPFHFSNEGSSTFAGTLTTHYKAIDELAVSIYDYLKEIFKKNIETILLNRTFGLNNSVFGIQEKDKLRSLHLFAFKECYDMIKLKGIDFAQKGVDENGITDFQIKGCFFNLNSQKNAFKYRLAEDRVLIINFLFGNTSYFDVFLLKDSELLRDIVNFEGNLQFLLKINNQYKFEEDHYFNVSVNLNEIYNKVKHIFLSYQAFVFMYKEIVGISSKFNSNIESLYEAAIAYEIINENKTDFMKYLQQFHNQKITKIRDYVKVENKSHQKRVQHYMRSWREFAN